MELMKNQEKMVIAYDRENNLKLIYYVIFVCYSTKMYQYNVFLLTSDSPNIKYSS